MPLGLLALTASLRETGFTVEIYKPKIRLLKLNDFRNTTKDILKTNPKFVGFSTWCNSFSASLLIAEQIKHSNPKVPIIFGGPQASILTKNILTEFIFVDFILSGEADHSLPQLLHELKQKKRNFSQVQGLYHRNRQGEIIQNELQNTVTDLNKLPVPAYELVPKADVLKLDVGRGCPFKCTYCTTNSFFSKKYRTKSAERIIREMEAAYEKSKITSFSFAHDLFTFNNKFVIDFCSKLTEHNEIKKRNYKWTCSARIDCVSEELIGQMKSAGCESIFFGIESGSKKIQKNIKKNLSFKNIRKIANKCMQVNLKIYASFILGFPDETKTDIEKTLKLILELACKGAFVQASELAILPGTPLYKNYIGKLIFDGTVSNFSHSIIGKIELGLIQKYPSIFSSFYHLPINAVSRETIVLLCRFINILRDFRNTFFLIEDEIKSDIISIKLLDLFAKNRDEIKQHLKADIPPATLIINLIKRYLEVKFGENIPIQTQNVFMWEATQNLLKNKYLRWQIFSPPIESKNLNFQFHNSKNKKFKSSPIWHVLYSKYDLNAMIPEKNNWLKENSCQKKGKYFYLITATSDKSCKLFTITNIEYELLNLLQNNSVEKFLEKGSNLMKPVSFKNWLLKLINLGVIYQI